MVLMVNYFLFFKKNDLFNIFKNACILRDSYTLVNYEDILFRPFYLNNLYLS